MNYSYLKKITQRKLFLTLLIFKALIILSAIYIEYVLGVRPCALCQYQRAPYIIAILLSFFGYYNIFCTAILRPGKRRSRARRPGWSAPLMQAASRRRPTTGPMPKASARAQIWSTMSAAKSNSSTRKPTLRKRFADLELSQAAN